MKRLLSVCLLLLSFNAYGALNKWVGAEGKVHYSDELPPDNAKVKTLNAPRDPDSGASAQKTFVEREAEMKRAQKPKEKNTQKAAQEQADKLERRKSCAEAKSNLMALENGAQTTSRNGKGEAIHMDNLARRQNIEEARKQISIFCGAE